MTATTHGDLFFFFSFERKAWRFIENDFLVIDRLDAYADMHLSHYQFIMFLIRGMHAAL